MNKNVKVIVTVLIILIVTGAVAAWFMWNKPERKVENEKGIVVAATQLVKEYQADEKTANTKYLDKAIQVTGSVSEVKKNQDGKETVTLASEDPFTGVFCTLKETAENIQTGSTVTIKGICSGMLSDVRLREAVIVK